MCIRDSYIHHPLAVATIVAKQGLDDITIAAALLHDAVEDTKIEISHLEEEFGPEVALIVDGVTKLDRLNFDSKEEQQSASMRKMLVALAKDLRVLIIKLADRLHNMRTLAALPEFKQERTARETLDIYAPLAHRLGMEEVKVQLEDLSLATLYPKRYSEIDQMVSAQAPERDLYLTQMVGEVESRFKELGIDDVYCVSVNDGFVMRSWGASMTPKVEKVFLCPDGDGKFTEAMGMLVDKPANKFGKRSWRYSAVINDGVVEKMFVEPGKNNTGDDMDPFTVSDADTIIAYLKG